MTEDLLKSDDDAGERREVFRYAGVRLMPETAPVGCYAPGRRAFIAGTAVSMPIILFETFVIALVAAFSAGHATAIVTGVAFAAIIFFFVRLRNGRLAVDERGIGFPGALTFAARGKLSRPWQELKSIDVDTQNVPYSVATHTKVLFQYNDGSVVPVNLLRMTQSEVHSFRNALLRWSPVSHPRINDMAAIYENETDNSIEFARAQFSLVNSRFALGAYDRACASDQIGDYTIASVLAAGHASALYLAADASGKQVRLREFILPDDCADKDALMHQLITTADRLRSIEHDYICAVLDAFAYRGRFYYALENKGDRSMCQLLDYDILLQRNPLQRAAPIALSLARLVADLHLYEPYPVHGHIYPGVFRFNKDRAVYLADFGFAHNLITQSSGVFSGDMCYAAPEQLNGSATAAGDVYGLAATIFYLYSRKDPHPLCPSTLSIHGLPVPPSLDALIAQCTAYSAGDRPQTVASIAEKIKEIVGDDLKVPVQSGGYTS